MLIPALGFIAGCLCFGLVGVVLLRLRKPGRFRLIDLGLFVAGAMPTSAVAGWLYGLVAADWNGQLKSGVAVVGLSCVLLVSGAVGGLGAIWLFNRGRGG